MLVLTVLNTGVRILQKLPAQSNLLEILHLASVSQTMSSLFELKLNELKK